MKKFQSICGHLPSFDELIEFDAVSPTIKCNLYDIGSNIEERVEYLKKLSKYLITYLNISQNVIFTFESNTSSYTYYISILENIVKIVKKDETEIYEFDKNEILNINQ